MDVHTDPVNDFIASLVRRIRIEKGIRVADMAKRTGIALGSYSCLETGRYRISLINLFRILHVLGTDISQVWPGEICAWAESVDDDFIREWIEEARAKVPPIPTIEDVVEAVLGTYDLDREALVSASRKRRLAHARAAATILVRETPHLSLVALARELNRDVSSLSHAITRSYDRLSWDREFRLKLRNSRRRLNSILRARHREQKEELCTSQ